jgi:hypothetical protein
MPNPGWVNDKDLPKSASIASSLAEQVAFDVVDDD